MQHKMQHENQSRYSTISPGWHSNKRHIVDILSHDTSSLILIFWMVASPKILSFRRRYVEYPFFFNSAKTSILYCMDIIFPLHVKKYITVKHFVQVYILHNLNTKILCILPIDIHIYLVYTYIIKRGKEDHRWTKK